MLSVVVTNSNGSVHAPDIDNDTLEQLVIVGATMIHANEEYDGGTEQRHHSYEHRSE